MAFTIEIPIGALDTFIERLPESGTADVTIEVLGGDLGDQIEAERLSWHGMVYDSVRGVLEISVGGRKRTSWIGLRHEISDIHRIWAEEHDGRLVALSIDHGDGLQTIVRFQPHAALGADDGPGATPVLMTEID